MPALANLKFDTLLAVSSNPYVVFTPDNTIVWANAAYLEATRRSLDQILGRKWHEAFPQDPESEGYRQMVESLDRVRNGERDSIALIRYAIARPDGTEDVRCWSSVHTPLLDDEGQVAYILSNPVDVTELHELRSLRAGTRLVDRARRVEQRNAEAAIQIERSRAIVEQAPGIVSVLMGPNHRFELANAACRAFWGRAELVGHTVAEILPEAVEQAFIAMLDEVFSSGQAFVGQRVSVRRITAATGDGEERYVDCIFQPIIDADGIVIGIYAQGSDVTDQVRADEQQALLVNELNHRVKNTLSIIQGLAYQSFGKLGGGDAAYEGFRRRLNALAAAHSLLTDAMWEAAGLHSVISTALQAATGSDAARCVITGAEAELSPQSAVGLSMIVHELATNAIKYGALSDPQGRVEIALSVRLEEADHVMTVVWRETGGPPVTPPLQPGFGTRLIRRGLANHPSASATLDFAPGGLTCTIVAAVA